jgi:hypothetical protein
MIFITKSYGARRDIRTRQHLMERSYARSVRYGFDKARWRGLWKIAIQEYLISAIQNIETLIRYLRKPLKGIMAKPFNARRDQTVSTCYEYIFYKLQLYLYRKVGINNLPDSTNVSICGGCV